MLFIGIYVHGYSGKIKKGLALQSANISLQLNTDCAAISTGRKGTAKCLQFVGPALTSVSQSLFGAHVPPPGKQFCWWVPSGSLTPGLKRAVLHFLQRVPQTWPVGLWGSKSAQLLMPVLRAAALWPLEPVGCSLGLFCRPRPSAHLGQDHRSHPPGAYIHTDNLSPGSSKKPRGNFHI